MTALPGRIARNRRIAERSSLDTTWWWHVDAELVLAVTGRQTSLGNTSLGNTSLADDRFDIVFDGAFGGTN
jgi:hypothetical protein